MEHHAKRTEACLYVPVFELLRHSRMRRARGALDRFAAEHGLRLAARYVENESDAKLQRPELFRLLQDCDAGDVLLVEQVDRLSRLSQHQT